MKLAISVPSGYNARELLLPLRERLDADDAIEHVLVVTPAAAFQQDLFPVLGEKYLLTEALGNQQADVVITPTIGLDPRDTPILRDAKQRGIPTLTFVASWDNVFKMERLLAKGHSGTTKEAGGAYEVPDYFAFWNAMNQDHTLRIFPECDPSRARITGPPRFDYFSHEDRIPTKQQLLEFLGFEVTAGPLLHGATTELYPFDYILAALDDARSAGTLPTNANLYASVHPGGDMAKHNYAQFKAQVKYSFGRREGSPHPDFKYLPTDEQTYMLIALFKHTDVLVNQSSTVAIESMAADVPVINVKYGKAWDWWHWYRSMVYRDFKEHYRYITEEGGTRIVGNDKELINAVQHYLEHPESERTERQKTIEKMITYTDGSCGQRLLDFAKEIAQ